MEKKELIFAEERKKMILDLLKENKKLLVPELCSHFAVSPATIRNDLRELESEGLLKRTHGGALSNNKAGYEPDSYQKGVRCLEEKQAIARFAAGLVEDGDTIAVDTGTTTLEFVKLLREKKNLTVVTNDIAISRYLEDYCDANIILAGGIIRKNFHCTVGSIALQSLEELYVDKAFMGTNGLTVEKGLTTPDINQAQVKKAIIRIASETIVLCDSSKIGGFAFAQVIPVTQIDRIITDNGIDKKDLKAFEEKEIQVDVITL